MATLIGTPPNALMAGYFSSAYGYSIGFAEWMAAALPLSLVLLFLSWLVLTRFVFRLPSRHVEGADQIIRRELEALGPFGVGEKITATVFFLAAVSWITRPVVQEWIPGIELSDAGIAMFAALALFVIPIDLKNRVFVLDWDSMREIPWGVLLLFGGGLSLAAAVTASGLAPWIAASLTGLAEVSTLVLLLAVVATMVFLTELTSNTATTAAILPLLAGVAVGIGESPLLLAVPATLAASCAFMLPAATPPNAIVFGSGKVTIPQMARAGFWLNILAIVAITVFAYTVMHEVFSIEPGTVPDWARGKH
jgi:sodium-dependent dicarboxylate transporter 2/3/5